MAKKAIPMPKEIRLAGRYFKLALTPKGGFSDDTFGQYIPLEGRIAIREGMSADQTKATVLHEMVHDFDGQSACDLSESQVNSLSALMFAALRDNPKFVEWLMDR